MATARQKGRKREKIDAVRERIGTQNKARAAGEFGELIHRGRLDVYVRLEGAAWEWPASALVIPVGSTSTLGGFGNAVLKALGADAEALRVAVNEGQPVASDKPVLLRPGFSLENHFILATAHDGHSYLSENAGVAAKAVAELAAERGFAWVVMPLVGSGDGGADSVKVALAMLRGLLAADLKDQVLAVTLFTLNDRAHRALLAQRSSRSQPISNDLAHGRDLLEVESEAHAIMSTLLLSDVRPPLVAGVFGGWGDGKSFVMHLMKERMQQIRAMSVDQPAWPNAEQHSAFPWIGHSYAIEFDAWTYAKDDLWASLLQQIFMQLDDQLSIEKWLRDCKLSDDKAARLIGPLSRMSADARATLLKSTLSEDDAASLPIDPERSPRVLWKRIEDQWKKELSELETKRIELAEQQETAARARADLRAEAERQVERAAFVKLAKALGGTVSPSIEMLLDVTENGSQQNPCLLARPPTIFADLWSVLKREWPYFAGVLVAISVITYLVAKSVVTDSTTQVITTAIAAVSTPLVAAWRRADSWIDSQWTDIRDKLVAERANRTEEVENRYLKLLQEASKQSAPLQVAQDEIARLEAEVDSLKRRTGIARYHSLVELVRERTGDSIYVDRLGHLHSVQRDLRQLTNSLTVSDEGPHADEKKALFPRGPARVVLFIDDLDRCPPTRVVEVLEAVQLLVKTDLFVVVIAMDERYVTRALETKYAGILSQDIRPTGLDYIEKIVQIPYRVRPVSVSAMARYLGEQMRVQTPEERRGSALSGEGESEEEGEGEGEADESSETKPTVEDATPGSGRILPPHVLLFDKYQYENLTRCCQRLELSPRASKRMVNVYKLLKIIWFEERPHRAPEESVEKIVIALLCLSASYSAGSRRLIRAIDDRQRRNPDATFSSILTELRGQRAPSPRRQLDWEALLDAARELLDVERPISVLPKLTLDLIVSFSFIGDPDEVDSRLAEAEPSPKA
jgi:hypothetical protein